MDRDVESRFVGYFLRYGWIILMILLAFTVFVNVGFFSLDPSTCELGEDVLCVDFEKVGNQVSFTVQNTLDEILLGVDVDVEGCEGVRGKTVNRESEETFVFSNCDLPKQFRSTITFSYIDSTGSKKIIHGQLIKKLDVFRITA